MFCSMDKPAIVYFAIHRETGAKYIGVTGRPLDRRRYNHVYDAMKGKGKGAFPNALRKYGGDAFDWVIHASFEIGRDAIAEERRLIRESQPELNSTIGGEGFNPTPMSEEGRRKVSNLHKGNKYCLGKTHSAETRAKLKQWGLENKDGWLARNHLGPDASAKRVVCLNDGAVHKSASEAARAYGVIKSAVIEVCLRYERRRTVGELVFRYYGDHEGGIEEAKRELNRLKKTNTSGIKGVYPYVCDGKQTGRWRAQIMFKGKKHHLGLFDTPEEANAAYLAAKARGHHGVQLEA